ncbi:MAG: aldo/keto reductase [Clostridia bacterium]|nr:aldo/keto reductase [Clostridia bacterium]
MYTNIPKLGFGLMRLPMCGESVDIEQTKLMVDRFIEAGFTYFDTARGYIGGLSERAVKDAISSRYDRASFLLADKYSWWCVEDGDNEGFFASQLERTGVEYFDFYLIHSLTESSYEKYNERGAFEFCADLKKRGLIKNFGFSFHDKAEFLDKVLTEHPEVDFVQLQINYLDWESEGVQSRLCYETARKHGKSIVIMEPVKGGALAVLPEEGRRMAAAVAPDKSPASLAIRFAASLDGVITVLSGMSDRSQAEDNIATMSEFAPLNEAETEAVAAIAELLNSIPTVGCTACKYCTEKCPMEINIPSIIRGAYNSYLTYDNLALSKGRYKDITKGGALASACIGCGACMEVCPQEIAIPEYMMKASALFED